MPDRSEMLAGSLTNILAKELAALENIHGQNPDTGAGVEAGYTYLNQYTNRIFGAPFQLIDSVDQRFPVINENLGAEFMRNFTLNSPILHIKPGMTKYTGGQSGSAILKTLQNLYVNKTTKKRTNTEILLNDLAKSTVFKTGSKLQRRMFGFQDTYYQYMSHVNYMCRSMAAFLCLTSEQQKSSVKKYPTGTFTNASGKDISLDQFDTMDWSNYRFLSSSKMMTPMDELAAMSKSSMVGSAAKKAINWLQDKASSIMNSSYKDISNDAMGKAINNSMYGTSDNTSGSTETEAISNDLMSLMQSASDTTYSGISSELSEAIGDTSEDSATLNDVIVDKVSSVMFMVEPVQFEETITNTIEPSAIEQSVDSINQGVGQELAFITNSNVDFGTINGLVEFLGDTVSSAAESVSGLVEKVSGGFLSNLLHGAVGSVKGQKMIYPDIYKSSNTEMNYNYTVNLVSPYGDDYNYYMNIVVPLIHLICLAAPRAVTANSISSPYIVQTWMPGICTCKLGMISEMHITKNPNLRHVSVHGFPLEVKVTFTVRELYNTLSISPANDPASFLFNETLNDYMANLGGLSPSADTYDKQRTVSFDALENYLKSGEYANDFLQGTIASIEGFVNPYIANGQ